MSVFQQLLQIREFREQRAQAAVQAERAALRRATEARDAASAELDTFKAYAQAREAALFGHLLARVVQVRDIQDVRHEVGELRVKERGHAQALEHAEEQRTKQSQALDAARARHQAADRTLQKIAERVAIDQVEAAWSREQAEEMEREDSVKMKSPDLGVQDMGGSHHA